MIIVEKILYNILMLGLINYRVEIFYSLGPSLGPACWLWVYLMFKYFTVWDLLVGYGTI